MKTKRKTSKTPFDGVVRDPSKPSHVLLPPLGMTITDGERRWLVEVYGEQAVDDWHRRNAAFLAEREGEVWADDLTEDEKLDLLRALVAAGLI
jgi:hypothetical protein